MPLRRPAIIAATVAAVLAVGGVTAALVMPRQSTPTDPLTRARALVARMTLDEEISQAHSVMDPTHMRITPGIPRLGIPDFEYANGPAGVAQGRVGSEKQAATAMPAPIALATTFDTDAATQYGATIGLEAQDLGYSLLEGPDLNIARMPQGGRTFESFGEDPFLTGQIGAAEITGIQSNHVIADAKHFAVNEQETNRTTINEVIDQRTLREIYLPPFKAAVTQGHVGSIMCAYPKLNGTYNCQDSSTLTTALKNQWQFPGFVMNDFGATHTTVADAMAGHDYESITDSYFDSALKQAVLSGKVPKARLDDMVVRRLATWIASGSFDHPNVQVAIPTVADGQTARAIAEEGMVLLRNTHHILPINVGPLHQIALIGPYATAATTGGNGSSHVKPAYSVAPRAGLRSRLPNTIQVSLDDGTNLKVAAAAAKAADIAVVMVGTLDGEGHDRTSLYLSRHQDALVEAVAAANPKTIVVLHTGSAVFMPWLSKVGAVLEAWYPGEEDGNAVADVLLGNTDPSGRLPITFPAQPTDLPATKAATWPGVGGTVTYSEGLDIGYRHYDQANINPRFPFGFGLSYTTFSYAHLAIAPSDGGGAVVSFDVTNVGKQSGAAVPQVYVGFPASAHEPPKRLAGFTRVPLFQGETRHVSMTLPASSFATWDTSGTRWTIAPGSYSVMLGESSRDMKLTGALDFRVARHLQP